MRTPEWVAQAVLDLRDSTPVKQDRAECLADPTPEEIKATSPVSWRDEEFIKDAVSRWLAIRRKRMGVS